MLFLLQFLSVAADAAGIAGFFRDITWLLIAGAVVSFLTLFVSISSSHVENKLLALIGSTAGMFIVHFACGQKWGISFVLSMCFVCLVLSLIGLISVIRDKN